ncbi:unnamed protein product [Mycena citricolor]|uniref:Uncharacterized protein n=1 Tax=Mycena citricolor TaxID=2018698 RepID=A0AAD2HGG2_9AGAR|nr:unnamed protein product [Mycena citricolor]
MAEVVTNKQLQLLFLPRDPHSVLGMDLPTESFRPSRSVPNGNQIIPGSTLHAQTREKVVEILANTANGCLDELGLFPGIKQRYDELLKAHEQANRANDALWRDNDKLVQSCSHLRNKCTQYQRDNVKLYEDNRTLVQERSHICGENEQLKKQNMVYARSTTHYEVMGAYAALQRDMQAAVNENELLKHAVKDLQNSLHRSGANPAIIQSAVPVDVHSHGPPHVPASGMPELRISTHVTSQNNHPPLRRSSMPMSMPQTMAGLEQGSRSSSGYVPHNAVRGGNAIPNITQPSRTASGAGTSSRQHRPPLVPSMPMSAPQMPLHFPPPPRSSHSTSPQQPGPSLKSWHPVMRRPTDPMVGNIARPLSSGSLPPQTPSPSSPEFSGYVPAELQHRPIVPASRSASSTVPSSHISTPTQPQPSSSLHILTQATNRNSGQLPAVGTVQSPIVLVDSPLSRRPESPPEVHEAITPPSSGPPVTVAVSTDERRGDEIVVVEHPPLAVKMEVDESAEDGMQEDDMEDMDEDDENEVEVRLGPDGLRLVEDSINEIFGDETGSICGFCTFIRDSGLPTEDIDFTNKTLEEKVAHCITSHPDSWDAFRRAGGE